MLKSGFKKSRREFEKKINAVRKRKKEEIKIGSLVQMDYKYFNEGKKLLYNPIKDYYYIGKEFKKEAGSLENWADPVVPDQNRCFVVEEMHRDFYSLKGFRDYINVSMIKPLELKKRRKLK